MAARGRPAGAGRIDGVREPQRLHARLHEAGSPIGLATVYRALGDLAAEGDADSLQSPDGEALYRTCATGGHHHHLICRVCGKTVEIAADEVESWAHDVAARNGFTAPSHVVDVFGLCAECTRRAAEAASAEEPASTTAEAPASA